MTTLTQTPVAALGSTAATLSSTVAAAAGEVRVWLTYADTVQELRKLSAKNLADIGAEGGVEGFAWEASKSALTR